MDLLVGAPGGVANSIPAGGVPDFEQARIPGKQFTELIKISLLRRPEEGLGFDFFRNQRSFLGFLQRQNVPARS